MQKYQEENPNNARVFIDYRKDKDKVRFERVGESNYFQIALNTWIGFNLKTFIYIPSLLYIILILGILFPSNILVYYFLRAFFIILFLTIYVFGGALILSKTKLVKFLPKLNVIGSKHHFVFVTPEMIKENKFEISLFKNILLQYKATGDMSDKLERIEIVEHPFNRLLVTRKGEVKQFP